MAPQENRCSWEAFWGQELENGSQIHNHSSNQLAKLGALSMHVCPIQPGDSLLGEKCERSGILWGARKEEATDSEMEQQAQGPGTGWCLVAGLWRCPLVRTVSGGWAESEKWDPGQHSEMHHSEAAELPGWNPYHPPMCATVNHLTFPGVNFFM